MDLFIVFDGPRVWSLTFNQFSKIGIKQEHARSKRKGSFFGRERSAKALAKSCAIE